MQVLFLYSNNASFLFSFLGTCCITRNRQTVDYKIVAYILGHFYVLCIRISRGYSIFLAGISSNRQWNVIRVRNSLLVKTLINVKYNFIRLLRICWKLFLQNNSFASIIRCTCKNTRPFVRPRYIINLHRENRMISAMIIINSIGFIVLRYYYSWYREFHTIYICL